MRNLITAESLKLRTTRSFWAYVISTLAFVPLSITLSMTTGTDEHPLSTHEGIRGVFSASSSGYLIAMLLGIMMTAGEFRHNTTTPTFLISPDRRRVMVAKLVTAGSVGLVLAAIASVLTLGIGWPWLHARHIAVSLMSADVATPLVGALLSTTLAAVFGIGIGALLRNQTVAVTLIVVWTGGIEVMLTGALPAVGRWLPTGAATALGGTIASEGGLLPFWAAAALLAGYAIAAAGGGSRLITRKDLT